jgi:hypothetical protein
VGSDNSCLTRLYFQYSGSPPNGAACNGLASSIIGAANTNLKPLSHSSVSLTAVSVQDLNSTSGAFGQSTTGYGGTRTGSATAASNTLLTNYAIGRRYRGGKPRSFWPMGVATDLFTPQQWTAAFSTAALAGLNAFYAACIGATSGGATITAHANVSYYQGFTNVAYGSPPRYRQVPTLRPGGPVIDTITGLLVSPIPGSQRRRLRA